MTTKEQTVTHRKSPIAIKHADGEPLTREDLQYDLLQCIFEDQHAVFTDPFQTIAGEPEGSKVTFRDLYVNALIKSPRSSKILREKLIETHDFATDFAKIALLTNVGRINTTMAFFPEMRTQLRTYHPIPAFQRQESNLQDAPRIKNSLKACLLPNELKNGAPSTPSEILTKRGDLQVPSTSVVNLIFVMSNHGFAVAKAHIEDYDDFLDLFRSSHVRSIERAKVILWLCFHYLESPSAANPYADRHARENSGKAPRVETVESSVSLGENIDTEEEIDWAKKMTEQRRVFLLKSKEEGEKRQTPADDESTGVAGPSVVKEGTPRPPKARQPRKKAPVPVNLDVIAVAQTPNSVDAALRAHKNETFTSTFQQMVVPDTSRISQPYPPQSASAPAPAPAASSRAGKPTRSRRKRRDVAQPTTYQEQLPPSPERSMFQHAWHVITTTNPLVDSDDEMGDHHARLDYVRRLNILKRLKSERSPSPDFQPQPAASVGLEVDTKVW